LTDLSIIIVSWNTRELLRGCLRSLDAATGPLTHEIIVVDNASSDGSADLVKRDFPLVHLIENVSNTGFACANNQGIQASSGRCVVLLNSDTVVPQDAFARLAQFMDAHPDAGACSPRLVQLDGRPQAFAFGGDPAPGCLMRRAVNAALFHRPLHDWGTERTLEVDWVSGACLFARRQAIDQAGLLDEAMFMYFEDNDWCLRMRRCGWKIYYHPQVSITHLGGQSLKQNPDAQRAYYESLRTFYRKHYGWLARAWLKVFLPIYASL
jgi:hypothetical protein